MKGYLTPLEQLIFHFILDFTKNKDSGTLNQFSVTDGMKATTTLTNSATTSDEFTNMHSSHHRTVTSQPPIVHDLSSSEIKTHTSRLLKEITTPNVFTATFQKTTSLTPISTDLQETTPLNNQFTSRTHSLSRTTLHESNVSLTSNDLTTVLTDLTTATLHQRNVTDSSIDRNSLGTKQDQMLYVYIITPILFICTLLSVYALIKKRNKKRHRHTSQQPNNYHQMYQIQNPIYIHNDDSVDDKEESDEVERLNQSTFKKIINKS